MLDGGADCHRQDAGFGEPTPKNELSATTDYWEPKPQVGMKIETNVWPVSAIQPFNAMTRLLDDSLE